jgi:hypothetical protein
MKFHKDGTLEGTPQEIAEYNRLMSGPIIEAGTIDAESIRKSVSESMKIQTDMLRRQEEKLHGSTDIMKIQEDVFKNRQPWERPMAIL